MQLPLAGTHFFDKTDLFFGTVVLGRAADDRLASTVVGSPIVRCSAIGSPVHRVRPFTFPGKQIAHASCAIDVGPTRRSLTEDAITIQTHPSRVTVQSAFAALYDATIRATVGENVIRIRSARLITGDKEAPKDEDQAAGSKCERHEIPSRDFRTRIAGGNGQSKEFEYCALKRRAPRPTEEGPGRFGARG